MTEEKYNTKDIRHINEKNQEYIAEGNRMTEDKLNESKHWESLYYKENALVAVLKQRIKSLEEEVYYLNGKMKFIQKYEVK